jgi:hypothetical protein
LALGSVHKRGKTAHGRISIHSNPQTIPLILRQCPVQDRRMWCAMAGDSHEKDSRECGTFSGADVFDSDGPGTCRRRCVGGLIGCRGARAGWCRRRSCHRLDGRPVDFAFVGPEPLEPAALCAESGKPGRSCSSKRQSTCAQSVCAQRSSSSSSGRPRAAVPHHHHGFHRTAGPGTGVSRYHH